MKLIFGFANSGIKNRSLEILFLNIRIVQEWDWEAIYYIPVIDPIFYVI